MCVFLEWSRRILSGQLGWSKVWSRQEVVAAAGGGAGDNVMKQGETTQMLGLVLAASRRQFVTGVGFTCFGKVSKDQGRSKLEIWELSRFWRDGLQKCSQDHQHLDFGDGTWNFVDGHGATSGQHGEEGGKEVLLLLGGKATSVIYLPKTRN